MFTKKMVYIFKDILNMAEFIIQKHPKCKTTFENLKSKSTVYPQKQTRTKVSGHAIESLNPCAVFITNILFSIFTIYLYIYVYIYE